MGWIAVKTPEVPREICDLVSDAEFFRRGRNSILKQLSIMLGQVVREAEYDREGIDVVICDRSLIDHWAYTHVLFGQGGWTERVNDVIDRFVGEYSRTYDHVVYVPIEFPPYDDGTREGEVQFQHDVDTELVHLLDRYGLERDSLTGDIQSRTALLASLADELLRKRGRSPNSRPR